MTPRQKMGNNCVKGFSTMPHETKVHNVIPVQSGSSELEKGGFIGHVIPVHCILHTLYMYQYYWYGL